MKKIMYRLMLIGLLLLFGTKAKAVQEADNVLYLPFDEGEGKTAKDTSPHKNDGIFQENAKWAKGKYGNSLSLDGDKGDWVEVPDSPSLDITDQITLMAWVYPTRFTAAWYRIVVKHWAKNEAPWMVYGLGQVGGTNGKTSFIISVDGGTEGRLDPSPFGPEGDKPEDTPALKPKVWTHLASTYDGKEMKLYYDGEVVAKKVLRENWTLTMYLWRLGVTIYKIMNIILGGLMKLLFGKWHLVRMRFKKPWREFML